MCPYEHDIIYVMHQDVNNKYADMLMSVVYDYD